MSRKCAVLFHKRLDDRRDRPNAVNTKEKQFFDRFTEKLEMSNRIIHNPTLIIHNYAQVSAFEVRIPGSTNSDRITPQLNRVPHTS